MAWELVRIICENELFDWIQIETFWILFLGLTVELVRGYLFHFENTELQSWLILLIRYLINDVLKFCCRNFSWTLAFLDADLIYRWSSWIVVIHYLLLIFNRAIFFKFIQFLLLYQLFYIFLFVFTYLTILLILPYFPLLFFFPFFILRDHQILLFFFILFRYLLEWINHQLPFQLHTFLLFKKQFNHSSLNLNQPLIDNLWFILNFYVLIKNGFHSFWARLINFKLILCWKDFGDWLLTFWNFLGSRIIMLEFLIQRLFSWSSRFLGNFRLVWLTWSKTFIDKIRYLGKYCLF